MRLSFLKHVVETESAKDASSHSAEWRRHIAAAKVERTRLTRRMVEDSIATDHHLVKELAGETRPKKAPWRPTNPGGLLGELGRLAQRAGLVGAA